jgi:uncharacterized membrane protein
MSTIEHLLFVVTLVAALGSGLMAGVFSAFSAFVMKALARLPGGEGIAAMQSINVVVVNPWFMTAFLGTAAVYLLALISVPFRWNQPSATCLLAGGVLYLIGTLWVTIAFNVPRNEALARVAPTDPDGCLRLSLDGVEPRSHGGSACGSGILQHGARVLSN